MLSFPLKKLWEIAADLPKKIKGRKPSILVRVLAGERRLLEVVVGI